MTAMMTSTVGCGESESMLMRRDSSSTRSRSAVRARSASFRPPISARRRSAIPARSKVVMDWWARAYATNVQLQRMHLARPSARVTRRLFHVADLLVQTRGTAHEGPVSARDDGFSDMNDRLSEEQTLRLMHHLAGRDHLALDDGRQQIHLKAHRQHEGVGDERLYREEGRIVEHLEVHGAVRCVRGAMHVGAYRHPDLRLAFCDVDERAEKLVYRAIYIHGFQRLKMAAHTNGGS